MSDSARKCVRFKNTDSGKRCAKYESDDHDDRISHRMSGMVSIPGLGAMFDKSVDSTDVIVGALAGMAGSAAFKLFASKFLVKTDAAGVKTSLIPTFLQNAMPAIGAIVTGAALFTVEKGKSRSRASGHLVGAVAAGAAVQTWSFLKGMTDSTGAPMFPGLADVVSLNLGRYAGRYGLLADERTPRIGPGGMAGLIVNDPIHAQMQGYADNPNLASLAAASMGDDASGMEELMGLDE